MKPEAALLAALEREAFGPEAWNEAQLRSLLDRHDAVALATSEPASPALLGEALGWAAGPVGELQRIAVAPRARRRGLGQALLRDFLQACTDRGTEEVWLEVRADNEAALALYRSQGFQETGRRRGYYADGGEAVLMSWLRP